MTVVRDSVKVLCYHASDIKSPMLSVSSLYLKTHFDHAYPEYSDRVTWITPIQNRFDDDQLIAACELHKPDILAVSHFIWNDEFLLEQLQRVRSRLPDQVLICSGGPSVRVKIEDDYLEKHSYIDYAFYAQGEAGFADLLASLLTGKKLIAFNTSNIAWFNHELGRQQVAPFRYVPEPKISPYLHCEELLTRIRDQVGDLVGRIFLPYQLTRGCPYACTFCDWNGGLTNKTTRRKNTYQQEIDLFQKLGFQNFYLVDANVGQYDEDVDLVRYMAEKNLKEGCKFTFVANMSKLKKENNVKIWRLQLEAGMLIKNARSSYLELIVAAQDVDPTVLKNIDRPDVEWDVHVKIINELLRDYPEVSIQVQLIFGLPGQTVESWRRSVDTVMKQPVLLQWLLNEPLPTSPAMLDPEYQKKWNYRYIMSERWFNGPYKALTTASSATFTQTDIVEMVLINIAYASLGVLRYKKILTMDVDMSSTVDRLLSTVEFSILRENLTNNWINQNRFYFTRWFGPDELMPGNFFPACIHSAIEVDDNPAFLDFVLNNVDKKYLNSPIIENKTHADKQIQLHPN
jgi:radical SAM superfamily enzyme YgiQ (UPF0313 family)